MFAYTHIITHKLSAIYDTMDTSQEVGLVQSSSFSIHLQKLKCSIQVQEVTLIITIKLVIFIILAQSFSI